jgi:hypothetical protein
MPSYSSSHERVKGDCSVGLKPFAMAGSVGRVVFAVREAVIVEAVRAPVAGRNGALSGIHPVDLSAHVLTARPERSGVDLAMVDDVLRGSVSYVESRPSTSAAMQTHAPSPYDR